MELEVMFNQLVGARYLKRLHAYLWAMAVILMDP